MTGTNKLFDIVISVGPNDKDIVSKQVNSEGKPIPSADFLLNTMGTPAFIASNTFIFMPLPENIGETNIP